MRGLTTEATIRSLAAACAVCALMALLWAGAARADERVYWANTMANTISYAAVDGAGGGNLNTTGAPISAPVGIVLDPVGGRIYWANSSGTAIGWARLDGTGGGTLNTTGTTVDKPSALTVNPATRTLYWINANANLDISFVRLNGSGAGDLTVPNSTTEGGGDTGMTFDPVSQRFYWVNPESGLSGSIGYETLGAGAAGAGSLNTGTVATLNYPSAIAYNNGDGSAYWTNDNGKIGGVRADAPGVGSENLNTTGATTTNQSNVGLNLAGIAVDERHFRIYWGGSRSGGPNKISYARLDNSGGADVDTTGATVSQPGGVALLDVPAPGPAPAVAGTPVTGSTLSCSQGSWQPDDTGAFYWRSPSSYTYAWALNGVAINNQTSSKLTPAKAGLYRCTVTASNAAGSAANTSKPVQVTASSPSGGGSGGGGGGGGGGAGGGGGPGSPTAPALALGRIHQTHRSWATHRDRARPRGAQPPAYGTTFTTTVNRAATLAYSFAALRPGRVVTHHCVKPTAHHRGARGCTRPVALGTIIRRAPSAGTVKLTFRGRLDHRTLGPGRYRLTITATAPSSPRRTRQISFAVIGPSGQP